MNRLWLVGLVLAVGCAKTESPSQTNAMAQEPDVVKTPSAPSPVPIPYPNVAAAPAPQSSTDKASGLPIGKRQHPTDGRKPPIDKQ